MYTINVHERIQSIFTGICLELVKQFREQTERSVDELKYAFHSSLYS